MLLILMRNSPAVAFTPLKDSKTAKASITKVIDPGEKFLIGMIDVCTECFASDTDTGEELKL